MRGQIIIKSQLQIYWYYFIFDKRLQICSFFYPSPMHKWDLTISKFEKHTIVITLPVKQVVLFCSCQMGYTELHDDPDLRMILWSG
jgi:hypothetical protein